MIARDDSGLRLEEDDIDDILYSVRTDDKEELDSFLKSLADKYSIAEKDVLQSSVAEHSGNTAVHFAAANGLSGQQHSVCWMSSRLIICYSSAHPHPPDPEPPHRLRLHQSAQQSW